MGSFTAVFDSCVLYPAPLRDLLMHLAVTDLFRAKWTEDIHEEWIRNVLKDHPQLSRERLERTRRLMDENVRDCLVTGHQALIDGLILPDANDRHVLAAAIQGNADVIVTFNLRHFPEEALAPYQIEAIHPDDFLLCQIDLSISIVCGAAKRHRSQLKNPPKSVDEYLASLERQGLPQVVAQLRQCAELI